MSYSKKILSLIKKNKIKNNDSLKISTETQTYECTLKPKYDFSNPELLTLNLKNGYDISLSPSSIISIENNNIKKEENKKNETPQSKTFKKNKNFFSSINLSIICTGGTISSKLDVLTGSLKPSLPSKLFYKILEELKIKNNITFSTKNLFTDYSENFDDSHWIKLSKEIYKQIKKGINGIIIKHGTDTLSYSSSIISFIIQNPPIPIVFVSSQIPSDRPSSDMHNNLKAAILFCLKNIPGVFVISPNSLNDQNYSIFLGTNVRKMHTSQRNAFKCINSSPIALIKNNIFILTTPSTTPYSKNFFFSPKLEKNVILVQCYPGMDPLLFEPLFTSSKGIILSGTGLGHTNKSLIPLLKYCSSKGIFIFMTSQCIFGKTNSTRYSTGHELLKAGVIYLDDMISETAFAKLKWILGNYKKKEDVINLMTSSIVGEINNPLILYD